MFFGTVSLVIDEVAEYSFLIDVGEIPRIPMSSVSSNLLPISVDLVCEVRGIFWWG